MHWPPMIRVALSAAPALAEEASSFSCELENLDIRTTCAWWDLPAPADSLDREGLIIDRADGILEATALLAIRPVGLLEASEIGLAIGAGIPVLCFGAEKPWRGYIRHPGVVHRGAYRGPRRTAAIALSAILHARRMGRY